jgi:hypothetical protein
VEQAAEEVAPSDLKRAKSRRGRRMGSVAAIRRSPVERSVWTLLVEVADVDAENVLELTAAEDQQPVKALPAHAADPPFGVVWGAKTPFTRLDQCDLQGDRVCEPDALWVIDSVLPPNR